MSEKTGARRAQGPKPAWHREIVQFTKPDPAKAIWQLVNTFIPYVALWAALIATRLLGWPYWITFLLTLPATFFMVRIFIFFHDAGHGSFFKSARANEIVGYVCGILTFTPYHDWRHNHATHHATAGNLDRRGVGDVWTMTVDEYLAAPWYQKMAYRVVRFPPFMFLVGPVVMFLIAHRWPGKGAKRDDVVSVVITNIALVAILVLAHFTIGIGNYLLIQLPIIIIGGAMGIWLFYVQHQYEDVYWARDGEWNATKAALEGSSYYKQPAVLRWLTGNIGLHHIHHLRPRVANYHLQACQNAIEAFQQVKPLTIGESLKSLGMHLVDEKRGKLVGFGALRTVSREAPPA